MRADPTDSSPTPLFRLLPKIDALLNHPELRQLAETRGLGFVTHHVRRTVEELRERVRSGEANEGDLQPTDVVAAVTRRIQQVGEALPRVLNGTGVILHSGLGRAPLSRAAADATRRAAGYSLLEVDRAQGDRLSRDTRAAELLCALTGAEAAFVVNNNAAATLLILSALGSGREVICSRGEMVEIGGSYRIPDVMQASGCRLVDVGTTNKTHLYDYERAITADTAALLVVHTSNYRVVGFTSTPPLAAVAQLAHERGLPLVHDLGSGSLLSPDELGFGDEPPVSHSLVSGADVVCMSGDKLLGGPQAGIILGRADLVRRMRQHPLARALRIDKMTAAALEGTLALFFDHDRLRREHPVTRMLVETPEELLPRAQRLLATVLEHGPEGSEAVLADSSSETGAGTLPTVQIPSKAVDIGCPGVRADHLAKALREQTPALFTRIVDGRVRIDVRTLLEDEDHEAGRLVARTLWSLKP